MTPHNLVPPDPEAWPEPVNGAELLSDLANLFEQCLVLPHLAAEALALWTVHTFATEAADHFPLLAILSPEKRSGKTTLLRILSVLARRPVLVANISIAVVFRLIEKAQPTLLIDEADTFLNNDELIGVLNSGHVRGGQVARTVGDAHEPQGFTTWGPKAVAAIGDLPRDTLTDRSIVVRLRRRISSDPQKVKITQSVLEGYRDVSRRIRRWAEDNIELLKSANPETPASLDDRQADNWRPLFAIAAVASAQWFDRARSAALQLSTDVVLPDPSPERLLLHDLGKLFVSRNAVKLSTAEIVDHLKTLPERRWKNWKGLGVPIDGSSIAKMLRRYGVAPQKVRVGSASLQGYVWAGALAEAVEAYGHRETEQPEHAEPDFDVPDVPDVPDGHVDDDTDDADPGDPPRK